MKKLTKYMFSAYFTLTVCFLIGYLAWKTNHKYEASKKELIITGKVEVFEHYDMYENTNPVIAVLDKGDEAKILDFYHGHDFGGIEVEIVDGRKGYIHFFRLNQNYNIVKKDY